MKEVLEQKLKKAFPNVYRCMDDPKCRWSIRMGLSCGDGWYEIIYDASMELEEIIQRMAEKDRKKYWACQIKEKFGGLRFYLNEATDEMWKITRKVEALSEYVCEECGDRGNTVKRQTIGNWLQTLCRSCRTDRRIKGFFRRLGGEWSYFMYRIKERLFKPFRKGDND